MWGDFSQGVEYLPAAHARHNHIENNQGNLGMKLREKLEGLLSAPGSENLVTLALERAAAAVEHELFVIDDQKSFTSSVRLKHLSSFRDRRCGGGGKKDGEG